MPTTTAQDQLDRARRTAKASEYKLTTTKDWIIVEEPAAGLWRWREVCRFKPERRAELEAFLTAMLPPPRDHTPDPKRF